MEAFGDVENFRKLSRAKNWKIILPWKNTKLSLQDG